MMNFGKEQHMVSIYKFKKLIFTLIKKIIKTKIWN